MTLLMRNSLLFRLERLGLHGCATRSTVLVVLRHNGVKSTARCEILTSLVMLNGKRQYKVRSLDKTRMAKYHHSKWFVGLISYLISSVRPTTPDPRATRGQPQLPS